MTCTILFELAAPGETRATKTRYRVLGVTTDEFWRIRSDMAAFEDDLESVEARHGTIDSGASRTRTGRTTWDFCSQEARDKQAMTDAVLDLVRRHFGWTIEPK